MVWVTVLVIEPQLRLDHHFLCSIHYSSAHNTSSVTASLSSSVGLVETSAWSSQMRMNGLVVSSLRVQEPKLIPVHPLAPKQVRFVMTTSLRKIMEYLINWKDIFRVRTTFVPRGLQLTKFCTRFQNLAKIWMTLNAHYLCMNIRFQISSGVYEISPSCGPLALYTQDNPKANILNWPIRPFWTRGP